jgi:hypothetical protein
MYLPVKTSFPPNAVSFAVDLHSFGNISIIVGLLTDRGGRGESGKMSITIGFIHETVCIYSKKFISLFLCWALIIKIIIFWEKTELKYSFIHRNCANLLTKNASWHLFILLLFLFHVLVHV